MRQACPEASVFLLGPVLGLAYEDSISIAPALGNSRKHAGQTVLLSLRIQFAQLVTDRAGSEMTAMTMLCEVQPS